MCLVPARVELHKIVQKIHEQKAGIWTSVIFRPLYPRSEEEEILNNSF